MTRMTQKKDKNIEEIISCGLDSSMVDLTIDYAELSLDAFIDNEVVREIPIVKTIVGVIKGGLKVREIFFVKKLLTFLKEFHTKTIDATKLQNFRSKFEQDKEYRHSVIEQVVILNERFLEIKKSKILANLFAAHINDKFDWEGFQDLSVCLDNLHLRGVKLLEELENKETPFYEGFNRGSEEEALLNGAGIVLRWGTHLHINGHGQHLYYYGIKGDVDFEFKKKG